MADAIAVLEASHACSLNGLLRLDFRVMTTCSSSATGSQVLSVVKVVSRLTGSWNETQAGDVPCLLQAVQYIQGLMSKLRIPMMTQCSTTGCIAHLDKGYGPCNIVNVGISKGYGQCRHQQRLQEVHTNPPQWEKT